MLKKLTGSRAFYARILAVVLPILIQNLITNFVSLLDNIMVGQVGTEAMSGVAIVNQLIFVYYLGIFGLLSGIGIFTAQYFGKRDLQGIRNTFVLKWAATALYFAAALLLFYFFGPAMINSFLHDSGTGIDAAAIYSHAEKYLWIIMIGVVPFSISQIYSSTMREMQEARIPMIAGIAAVFINLFFNYVLIYGHFGAPALGVVGAAIATDISRFVELGINAVWAHTHKDKTVFLKPGLKADISLEYVKKVAITSAPLFINEFLWSASIALQNRIISNRGLEVVPAINIASTVANLCNTFYLSIGISLGIIVGSILGRGDNDEAVDTDRKMIFLSFCTSCVIGALSFIFAPLIANIYNTSPEVKLLASFFIRTVSVYMPMEAVINASYFTIRCGGKTLITFLFDSVYNWCVVIPTALITVNLLPVSVEICYIIICGISIIKLAVGLILVRKKIWINRL